MGRKLVNEQTSQIDCIRYGAVPADVLAPYVGFLASMQSRNSEIEKHLKVADRAFERFKKCRSQASQGSQKRSKNLLLQVDG